MIPAPPFLLACPSKTCGQVHKEPNFISYSVFHVELFSDLFRREITNRGHYPAPYVICTGCHLVWPRHMLKEGTFVDASQPTSLPLLKTAPWLALKASLVEKSPGFTTVTDAEEALLHLWREDDQRIYRGIPSTDSVFRHEYLLPMVEAQLRKRTTLSPVHAYLLGEVARQTRAFETAELLFQSLIRQDSDPILQYLLSQQFSFCASRDGGIKLMQLPPVKRSSEPRAINKFALKFMLLGDAKFKEHISSLVQWPNAVVLPAPDPDAIRSLILMTSHLGACIVDGAQPPTDAFMKMARKIPSSVHWLIVGSRLESQLWRSALGALGHSGSSVNMSSLTLPRFLAFEEACRMRLQKAAT